MILNMYKNSKTGMVGGIITLILLIILVIISNIQVDKMNRIENLFSAIINPIQNGITYLKNKIAGNDSFFTQVNELKAENEELLQKNSELEQSLRELEIIKAENATLKEYVDLKDKYQEYETVPAYVINKDIGNYTNTVIINAGKNDGIDVDMTVISEKGLVGQIVSVTDTTAKVQTLVDSGTAVSATIKTTGDNMLLRGTLNDNTTLIASYIPTSATLLAGDTIETSGLGGIYPKGILIGTIKEVVNTQNITDRYAKVETAVDFNKLNTVLVIKN